MTPRIGSLFSGYGGLDMAVEQVTSGRTVWVSDIDKGACKILAHRYPHIPNLGDITGIDWNTVEPIDILTGGFPCQDVSTAGRRAGLGEGTRTGLWGIMCNAIQALQPSLVVAENVRGLLNATAHRSPNAIDPDPDPFWQFMEDTTDDDTAADPDWDELEPGDGDLGDDNGTRPVLLRALGAVLGSLADIGYDASWFGMRAADVGAPHSRFRVFIVAWPRGGATWNPNSDHRPPVGGFPGRADTEHGGGIPAATNPVELGQRGRGTPGVPASQGPRLIPIRCGVPAQPATAIADRLGSQRGWRARERGPGLADGGCAPTDAFGGGCDGWAQAQVRGAFRGTAATRSGDAPAPDAGSQRPTRPQENGELGRHRPRLNPQSGANAWGIYAPAIARWEQVLGRPAPAPLRPDGKHGAHRLNPAAVEFMMGLPAGWVMDVPDLTRSEQLKACGNGVVPQQAAAALQHLLAFIPARAALTQQDLFA